ncbi:MAG: hypothetical protein WDZ59_09425 [Pirellulales bacterium]
MMRRRMIASTALVGVLLLANCCRAQEAQTVESLRYHRVFAPADQSEKWPLGDQRYLPIDVEQFEQLVRQAEQNGSRAESLSSTRIIEARFEARLADDQLVDGAASLTIVHDATQPRILRLGLFSLPAFEPKWKSDQREALLGFTREHGPSVLVEKTDTLEFGWSLQGRRDAFGELVFEAQLPPVPAKRIRLRLPHGMAPAVEGGFVEKLSPHPEAAANQEAKEALWHIELGGADRLVLRIEPETTDSKPSWLSARELLTYDLSPQGLTLSGRISLETQGHPIYQVIIEADPTLRLVAAKYRDADIPWTDVTEAGAERTRIVLELPEPIQGSGRVFISAIAPLVTDAAWRLPRIRAADAFWTEGQLQVVVPQPLVLNRILPIQCRQTNVEPLTGTRSGTSLELQAFGPDATAEVRVSRVEPRLEVLAGTTTEIAEHEINGRTIAEFQTSRSESFQLSARVLSQWIVDTVETLPESALGDWSLEEASDGRRTLSIQLAQALGPSRPLRVVIRGRLRRGNLAQATPVAELRMLSFENVSQMRELMLVRAAAPFQLRHDRDQALSLINLAELGDIEATLFGVRTDGLLFPLDSAAEAARFSLQEETPVFTGQVDTEIRIEGDSLVEAHRLTCTPASSRLDRVLVQFSHAGGPPLKWSLVGEPASQLTAERVSDPASSGDAAAEGETWELALRRPMTTPFAVRAQRTLPFTQSVDVRLASLPDATEQTGRLTIFVDGDARPLIHNHRLEPMPAELTLPQQFPTARATFRYVPSRDVADQATAAVTLEPTPQSAAHPLAWVWKCSLDTRCMPDGTAAHFASFRIENAGRRQVELSVPVGSELQAVWIDGEQVAQAKIREYPRRFQLNLPVGQRFPVVSLHYVSGGRPLRIFNTFKPRIPSIDLPIVASDWTLWLPPGYVATDSIAARPDQRMSWSQRLFGPLGRLPADAEQAPAVADSDVSMATAMPFGDVTSGAHPEQLARAVSPWAANWPAAPDVTGWQIYRVENAAGEPAGVRVVREQAVSMLSLVLFLAIAAVVYWKIAERLLVLFVLAGCAATAALLLPEAYASLATGVFMGTLAGGLIRLLRLRPSRIPATIESEASSTQFVLVQSVLFLAIGVSVLPGEAALGAPQLGQSASDRNSATAAAPTIHRLLIPTDSNGDPIGGKYYLSEEFYKALQQRAAPSDVPRDWMITGAAYRGSLEWNEAHDSLTPQGLEADYDLVVWGRPASVSLPFDAGTLADSLDAVRLDGRRATPQSGPDGSGIVVPVSEPGRYRISVLLRPGTKIEESTSGFTLPIPPVPASRLVLSIPDDAYGVEIETARGATSIDPDTGVLTAELGSTDTLAVGWPSLAPTNGQRAAAEVEELQWLDIRPGAVTLRVRWKLNVLEGSVRQLNVSADPRLSLLPIDEQSAITSQRTLVGERQQFVLRWDRPITDRATVDLRFRLSGASGVGHYHLPDVSLESMQRTRRLLAVSVGPELQFQSPQNDSLPAVGISEFSAAWGAASETPSLAYQLPAGGVDWSLATRPRAGQAAIEQQMAVCLGRGEAKYEMNLTTISTAGPEFQYTVAIPQQLSVNDVAVVDEGVSRPAHWWRDDQSGLLTVLLDTPPVNVPQLTVRGRMDLPLESDFTVPRIDVLPASDAQGAWLVQSSRLRVYRRPEVLVNVPEQESLSPVEQVQPGDGTFPDARLVGAFAVASGGDVTLSISPNRPQTSAATATALRFTGGRWQAEWICRLNIAEGVLDHVRLNVPTWWGSSDASAYTVEPAASVHVVNLPGNNRRQLTIRPRSPIGEQRLVRVRAAVSLTPTQRVRVPRVELQSIDNVEQYVVLPTQSDLQQVSWDTRGLRAAELPDHLGTERNANRTVYQVLDGQYQAVLQSTPPPTVAQIRLADVRAAVQADGSYQGVATFDLEPAGRASCVLELPEGGRLICATVAGLPATLEPVDPQRWRMMLGPQSLPQRVEVVFALDRTGVAELPGRLRLHAPRLLSADQQGKSAAIEVERTLWTVHNPASAGSGQTADAQPISRLRQSVLRLESTASLIELAAETAADQPADVIRRWYVPWSRRLELARMEVAREAAANPDAIIERSLADAVAAEQADVAQRLKTSDQWAQVRGSQQIADEPAELWRLSRDGQGQTTRCMFQGGVETVTMHYDDVRSANLFGRILAALALVVALEVCVLLHRRGLRADLYWRWPHALGVLGGLFWSLFLAPGFVGWIIIALSLGAIVHRGWRGTAPVDASTVRLPAVGSGS